MSKNQRSRREIVELDEVPGSSTPEPAPKRQRKSSSALKAHSRDSRRSKESGARATEGVIVSAAGVSEPRRSSSGSSAMTPAFEWSSQEETMIEGLLPAVERSSQEATVVGTQRSALRTPAFEWSSQEETMIEGRLPAVERSSHEETATVDGNDGRDLRTVEPVGTRDHTTSASDGRLGAATRTVVVERSSQEETVTTGMRVGQRPSVEAESATSRMPSALRPSDTGQFATLRPSDTGQDATDIVIDSHSAIGTHPSVGRASTGVLETEDSATALRQRSRTPSEHRDSTEAGTEALVPVMSNVAGGPTVDRTSTGGGETIALTPAAVTEEPCGEPTMVDMFTPPVGAATQVPMVDANPDGRSRPPVAWGQGIPI